MSQAGQQPRRALEFGPFLLDLDARRLSRGGAPVDLGPKAFNALAILAGSPGRVVEKAELVRKVWPDVHVDDAALAKTVFTIRKALGDDSGEPRFIETVPTVGYRFVSPVREVEASPAPGPTPGRRRPRRLAVALAAAAIAALGAGAWWVSTSSRPAPRSLLLVVLPFENMSGDPKQDFLADGFTEEMITELGQLDPRRLAVVARTSAMQYRGTRKGARQIAGELHADYLLEGSIRRAGDRVRVSAQLIRARDETHLWARSYDRDLRDILAFEAEVARAIAAEIELRLEDRVRTPRPTPRVDPEAFELYLEALYLWNRRDAASLEKAIALYERAIRRQPGVARFHAGLADAYALEGSLTSPPGSRSDLMERARAAAGRALELDPSLADAHAALAFVRMHYDFDWPGAEAEFREALRLDANYPTAHHWYAYFLLTRGRADDAVREARRAEALDPLSIIISRDVAEMLYYARRYGQSAAQCRRTLEKDGSFALAWTLLAWDQMQMGRPEEALDSARRAASGLAEADRIGLEAGVASRLGRTGEAERALVRLEELGRRGSYPAYSLAVLDASLGRLDAAFAWLERARREHIGSLILVAVDPMLDPLRGDPRFGALLREMRMEP